MKLKFFTLVMFFSFSVMASEFIPSYLLQLDEQFAHHVIVVEKSTHRLFVYKNENGFPKLIETYKVATGQIKGNKKVQGDKKTPEGIYRFQVFHSAKDLIDRYGETGLIYGAGAFTLNYPNIIDRRAGKTGGGIWLHSTDDDKRVDKGLDSRGCVVAVDADLKLISRYIDLLNTPAVIVQNLEYLSEKTWKKNKNEIMNVVNTWHKSWQSKDFKTYISQYSPSFYNARKGGYQQYKAYKRAVFSRTDSPQIDIRNLSILQYNNYAVVTMEQDYKSDIIQDIGKKILYLEQNDSYEWKIIAENWYSLPKDYGIAFEPKQRFFLSTENNNQTVVKFSKEAKTAQSTN
jgi:murein L,D-transpeptidase YafK